MFGTHVLVTHVALLLAFLVGSCIILLHGSIFCVNTFARTSRTISNWYRPPLPRAMGGVTPLSSMYHDLFWMFPSLCTSNKGCSLSLEGCLSMSMSMYVSEGVGVFFKLHVTTQYCPVIVVILCYSHWSSRGRIENTCYFRHYYLDATKGA